MATRSREDREQGPKPLGGVSDRGTDGALPAIDLSVGARQRFRVHVPTEDTSLLMGARVPVTRDEDATKQLGYDGFNTITNGHVLLASVDDTATVQSSGRVYVVSLTSSLSALAKGDVLIGSDRSSTTLAAKGSVTVIAGYGPSPQTVTLYGETPESPSAPDLQEVVDDHAMAALIASGVISVVTMAYGLIDTPRTVSVPTIAAYTLQTAGLVSGFKAIVEGATGKSLMSGFGSDLPSGVGIHGKQGVTITTSTSIGASIYLFAPVGSVTGIGAISAGLVGGVSANLTGLLAASVTGLAAASMQSLVQASVVSLVSASLESRLGTAAVRGAMVEVGQVVTTPPQLPTMSTTVQALMKVDAKAGALGLTAVELNGLLSQIKMKAVKKVTLEVLPYTLEVSPLGVAIKAGGVPVAEITPTKIALKQLPASSVEITPAYVKATAGPSVMQLTPAMAKVSGLKVMVG
ncbi:MAG: hypothetical protein IT379_11005 [Deltaproteobacteria bacterium]|nr:hypothetical protein [Deltaproteobacteria bacterium]